ncbi:hypothetical protein SK3146_00295 [Paenibacillus konkukensis]|uniref:Immunity protein 22 n=1 Tax=Paenibacillus konkukensis TaxID=2020716 RepID=A0ABY4RHP3_9BACL|nr:immunity 22 family protein [Paenibacillus konkukensis]UQZ81139.1 hypothetical protein SK3146_00295 [Paenibacillus konkukensis]
MKHIVTIWGTPASSEKELNAFTETVYDDDGEALLSPFLNGIGCSWIDEDFMERHYFGDEEERTAFIEYLRSDYAPHEAFAERLPEAIGEAIRAYPSVIILYGNDSPYGAINESLLAIAEAGPPAGSAAALLAIVEYESNLEKL